jgi:BASS family bile acid:Na+ symporter
LGPLRLLTDRNFLLLASIVLGFALGKSLARLISPLTLPALALAMTVSTAQVETSALRSPRALLCATLLSVGLNYLLLGGVTLLLARWLMPDRALWTGFVMAAAVPSGVAVIPFSYLLGGDTAFALIGSVGVYLSALLIMPLMTMLLVGSSFVQPAKLVIILLELVAIPLVLSRLILASRLKPIVERWRSTVVNWSFFLVILTAVGLNRDVLLREPRVLLLTAAVALMGNFGLGFVLERVLARLHVGRAATVTYVLMGTMKNSGLAAATALALFGERASMPAAVTSAINVVYLVWLGMRWERKTPSGDGKPMATPDQ